MMATIPYITGNTNKVFTALKMYNRTNALPLDPTSVFETKAQLESYISETGSYAYAGQIVAVANGNIISGNTDYSVYVIRSDKTLQDLTSTRSFDTETDAQTFITNNPSILPGEIISVKNGTKYDLYTIGTNRIISKVSFDFLDGSGIPWDSITNKPDFGTTKGTFAEGNHSHDKSSITSVSASVIDGVIPLANLPHGALERCVIVLDDAARFALTTDKVQLGDTVKVTSTGNMYFVVDDTKLNSEDGYTSYTTGSATEVPWSGITGVPTTLSGYGITDAVNTSEVVTTAKANKLLKLNSEGKLPASITGDAATLGGHEASYFIAAGTKFSNDDLNDIDWSKVTNIPTTLSGYGITDAVNTSEVTTSPSPNKLLKLNSEGKLPASITGDAATLGGHEPNYYMPASATFGNDDITDINWSKVENTPTTLSGYGITDAVKNDLISDTAEANKILKLNENGKLPASITGDAATLAGHDISYFNTADSIIDENHISGVNASVIKGVLSIDNIPHGALERCVVVANDVARFALTTQNVQVGDTVKVVSTGKMYFVVNSSKLSESSGYEVYTAGSATEVPWSGITGKPTSTATEIDNAVTLATHNNRSILDKLSENADGELIYDGNVIGHDLGFNIVVSASEPSNLAVGSMWFEVVNEEVVSS